MMMSSSVVFWVAVIVTTIPFSSARAATTTPPQMWNGTTGLTSVSSSTSNVTGELFWWFFPPRNNDTTAPLIIWLQGGPGASSIELGLLKLHGPYTVATSDDGTLSLARRDVSWNEEFAMLYVDQPVGTGYSYSTSGTYATSQSEIAAMLVEFLETFYAIEGLWPADNGLVVSGESYGGHYCPALGAAIVAKQPSTTIKLLGVSIGDGLTDPATQVRTKPAQAFAFGLVDEKTRAKAQAEADAAAVLCAAGSYAEAKAKRDSMEQIVLDASGINPYDVRIFGEYDESPEEDFLEEPSTRDALGLPPNVTFGTVDDVGDALVADVMRSYKDDVLTLIDAQVPVLLYQGQFDWKDGATSNAAWLETLFYPPENLVFGDRVVLETAQEQTPYGWIKQAKPTDARPDLAFFGDAVIASAGHMVPFDQPGPAKDMITRFIREWAPVAKVPPLPASMSSSSSSSASSSSSSKQ